MRLQKTNTLPALVGIGLILGVASAQAGYLVKENFDDGSAAFTATVPAGHANAVNIRQAGDVLHTSVNTGFDNFAPFSGRYLVLGDNASDLNNPLVDGTVGPAGTAAGQTSKATFGLGSFSAGSHSLGISFDYAFDTSLAPGTGTPPLVSPDDFFVRLMVGTTLIDEVLFFGDVQRNSASLKGTFNDSVNFNLASGGVVSLEFGLIEFNLNGDSAVGIDNLQVVPEPGSIALVGLALAGLAALRRRGAKAV
jgi:hypothetical protein